MPVLESMKTVPAQAGTVLSGVGELRDSGRMNPDDRKKRAAHAALDYLGDGMIVGVGTGSTVDRFIDALAGMRARIAGAVSSSEASTERLRAAKIEIHDLNAVGGSSCTSTAPTRRPGTDI